MKSEGLIWLPVILGLIVHILTVPLLMFGLKGPLLGMVIVSDVTESSSESYMHLLTENSDDVELSSASTEPDLGTNYSRREPVSILGSAPIKSTNHLYRILPHCLLPGAIYLFRDLRESYRFILVYWMSRRFHWDLRGVGWVQLGETLFTALIIALKPRFRKLLLSKNEDTKIYIEHDDWEVQHVQDSKSTSASAANQDLSLAQICLGFSLLGTVLLTMSWYRPSAFVSFAVLAVGMGFPDSYTGFLAGKIDEEKGVDLQDIYIWSYQL
jgi:hypothetical protein